MSKVYDVHRVQSLEKLEDLDSLCLNYWRTKLVQEVANKTGGRCPPCSLYGIVCGLKRQLEEVNGGNALIPLDSSYKRYFSSSYTLVQCALLGIEGLNCSVNLNANCKQ